MNKYEYLKNEACNSGIDVIDDYKFNSSKFKGLYCDGTIAISSNINTSVEKSCILAEEIGHHNTTIGNIIDMNCGSNQKQELQARLYGYNKLIGLQGLINAFEHNCTNLYETAKFLDVTEEFLLDTIKAYQAKYGNYKTFNNYVIMFNYPNVNIMKFNRR